MEILKIIHSDFELLVDCSNFESTFKKAQKKQSHLTTDSNYFISEGTLFLYDFESKNLAKSSGKDTCPVFFENKEYHISVEFNKYDSIDKAKLVSHLKELEEKFLFRPKHNLLSGTINFGNDIGKSRIAIRYSKNGIAKEFNFEFEVFPTKLNYKADHHTILSDINKQYPKLVLDFLKKTYTGFKEGRTVNTDLIWWKIFGGLYEQFVNASKLILNKPHSRIVRQTRLLKADKIIHWTPALEEQFHQFNHIPNKNYRAEYKNLSSDTAENRFFKHAVIQTTKRFIRLKTVITTSYKNEISETFLNELEIMEKSLMMFSSHPFLKTIGTFQGIKQESQVLQKASGYSDIYKAWIMLNSGIKFLEGIQKIELKNIAELYQIWCFLEIKWILDQKLDHLKHDITLAEIKVDDFVFKIERGIKSQVSYIKNENGSEKERIDLYHDLSFDLTNLNKVKSFTVKQKPDIVLNITKNDLKTNYVLTYLFDAKYRIASDENNDSPDFPTEDSINQMHRYRDAIYYINKENPIPEKEVLGAYVLFPGMDAPETVKNLDYFNSIQQVNIGAFPLSPGNVQSKILLEEQLHSVLFDETPTLIKRVSPHKELVFEWSNPAVFIGYVPNDDRAACYRTNEKPFYYTGKIDTETIDLTRFKYFAPFEKNKGVREYFEVLACSIVKRNELFPIGHKLHTELTEERLKLHLGKRFSIKDEATYFQLSEPRAGKYAPVYWETTLLQIRNPENLMINANIIREL